MPSQWTVSHIFWWLDGFHAGHVTTQFFTNKLDRVIAERIGADRIGEAIATLTEMVAVISERLDQHLPFSLDEKGPSS